MSNARPAAASPERLSRAAWHRKASRPVTWWMLGLVVMAFIHWAVPNYPWVLIHMFTLGVVGTSILIWSQHFTEQFLGRPLPEDTRPWQVRRIYLYTAAALTTIVGVSTGLISLVHAGAGVVAGCATFHSLYLLRQYLRADAKNPLVLGYVASTGLFTLGAILGAVVATGGAGLLTENLRLAHLSINVLGFVGLAAISTLSALFPRIWQEEPRGETKAWPLVLMGVGVLIAAVSALMDARLVVAGGLGLYLLGLLVSLRGWLATAFRVGAEPGGRLTFAALSVLAAPLWLVGALTWLAVGILRAETLSDATLPSLALLVGFGAQLLMGTMAYLLPTRVGGGPGAVATGLAIHDRAGMFRFGLINAGLAVWLLSDQSWLKVIASILALGALAAFLILAPVAAKAQVAVLRKQREPQSPAQRPKTGQLALAFSLIALVVAAFGGVTATTPVSNTGPADPANTHRVTIAAQGMRFVPGTITIPAGKTLVIELRNEDTLVHDLRFPNGARTGRVQPGETYELVVGQLNETTTAWCTIAGHHAQGMELIVQVEATTNSGTTSTPVPSTFTTTTPAAPSGITSR